MFYFQNLFPEHKNKVMILECSLLAVYCKYIQHIVNIQSPVEELLLFVIRNKISFASLST